MNARGIPAWLGCLLVSTALAACSSDPADDDLTPQSFAQQVARIKCAANAACCSAEMQTPHTDQCVNVVEKFELGRGEVFDAVAARRCLDELGAYTCDGEYPDVCFDVLTGTIPVGDKCDVSGDCARAGGSDAVCLQEWGADYGTCRRVVRSKEGGPCESSTATEMFECEEGQTCINQTCAPRLPAGAECFGFGCEEGSDCKYDGAAQTFLCVPYARAGEGCAERECLESAWCGPDQVCHAKLGAGDACQSDEECLDVCHPTTKRCTDGNFYCW